MALSFSVRKNRVKIGEMCKKANKNGLSTLRCNIPELCCVSKFDPTRSENHVVNLTLKNMSKKSVLPYTVSKN